MKNSDVVAMQFLMELSFCCLRFQTYQVTAGVTDMAAKVFSQVLSLRLERKRCDGFF